MNLTCSQGRYAKNAKPDLDRAWPQPGLALGLRVEKRLNGYALSTSSADGFNKRAESV
jgi:hypothetical protein